MTKEEVFSLETLEKGRRRFEKGKVKNIHMLDNMLYGSVYGNDLYKVKLELEGSTIKKMNCSCLEAQLGKRCRHEAAVVMALENEMHKTFDYDLNDNHREDRVRWALTKMSAKEKERVLYNYIRNDSKEDRHMVIFKYALKKPAEKENYILHKAKDVIDSYENYYALIDESDERLFEIVPQYAPIDIVFPFLEEYFKEGKEKETFKLLSEILLHLMKNSEATFNVFADKLLTFYVNLSKYITDTKVLRFTYLELRKALNEAPNYNERSLIYCKMVYGYIEETLDKEKVKDTISFFELTEPQHLIEASSASEVLLVDSLGKEAKSSKEYKALLDEYKFLPPFITLKATTLDEHKKTKEAIELINESIDKLERDYNYVLKDSELYILLSDLYKKAGDLERAIKSVKRAFKLKPTKEYLLKLKELEPKEEYQKDLLGSYLDLNEAQALDLLLDEGYISLALKIIDRKYTGKYALTLLNKHFDSFKDVDKAVLKEIVNSKINEAMETAFAVKYNDVLNYVKLIYKIDGNKCEAIKILKIWAKKFKRDDKFVEMVEKEIDRLEK